MDESGLEQWLSRLNYRAALVFTDVVGSTQILFDRQTLEFEHLLEAHRRRVATVVREFDGWLIETANDSTFAAFPTVAQACRYALSLQQDAGPPQIGVRCGVHVGSVRQQDGGLVGRNVYFAARVLSHGVGAEVWMSEAARQSLETDAPDTLAALTLSDSAEVTLKGVPEPAKLWRIY